MRETARSILRFLFCWLELLALPLLLVVVAIVAIRERASPSRGGEFFGFESGGPRQALLSAVTWLTLVVIGVALVRALARVRSRPRSALARGLATLAGLGALAGIVYLTWPRAHLYADHGAYLNAPLFLEKLVDESLDEEQIRALPKPQDGWDAYTVFDALESLGASLRSGGEGREPGFAILYGAVNPGEHPFALTVSVAPREEQAYDEPSDFSFVGPCAPEEAREPGVVIRERNVSVFIRGRCPDETERDIEAEAALVRRALSELPSLG